MMRNAGQLVQLLLTKVATIESRIHSLADATGRILLLLGGAGVGEIEPPEGVQLPLENLTDLMSLNNHLKDDKDAKKKLVYNILTVY